MGNNRPTALLEMGVPVLLSWLPWKQKQQQKLLF
jgi:hypothetical protein